MSHHSNHGRKVQTKRKGFLLLPLLVLAALFLVRPVGAATRPAADPDLLHHIYSEEEILTYEVSWLGLKAGELVIHLVPAPAGSGRYAIKVAARTAGLLEVFYPVEDSFETMVEGPMRLPTRYTVNQHEGSRRKKRLTLFDQQHGAITYQRNDEPQQHFTVDGPCHNEFSSFMIMRTLPLAVASKVMVPTFADRKRHEVTVVVEGEEEITTFLGKMDTIRVRPHLNFKGLYEKMGDPVIWLSNDRNRLPLLVKAKIVIGALTARLVAYHRGQADQPPALTAAPEPVTADSGAKSTQ